MNKSNRELFYKNKIQSYERQLEIEKDFVRDLDEQIKDKENAIKNPEIPNSEFIQRAKQLNKIRHTRQKSLNKIRNLEGVIKTNIDLLEHILNGTGL